MKILSPLEKIELEIFQHYGVDVYVKRDDLIDPIISGNKWRKLKFNVLNAKKLGYQGILSFGGAYSNHIHALAFAGKQAELKTIGIIRGEPHYQNNTTLTDAKRWGMELVFVDRQTYRQRHDEHYLTQLQRQYPDYFIVPEGGSNPLALPGVGEIIKELNQQNTFHHLLVPVGSGGTLAGLIQADNNRHNILGIAVLKQADYLQAEIKQLLANSADNKQQYRNWQLLTQFHGGGYGKFSQQAAEQIWQFNQQTGILFEPIYSGKMLLAFLSLLTQGYFKRGEKVVLIHTGGLQGIKGLIEQKRLPVNPWQLPFERQAH